MDEKLDLRFSDPALEAAFRRLHAKDAARSVAMVSFVAAMAVAGFGLLDLTIGHRPLPLLLVRYGFMVPLLLAGSVLVLQPKIRNGVNIVGSIILGTVAAAEASYLLWATPDRIVVYQTGFVLIVIGGYTCTRLRWVPVAIAAGTASVVDVAIVASTELAAWHKGALVLYVATANVLGGLVARGQERTARTLFLDTREIRKQKNEARHLNRRLQEQALTDWLTGLPNRRAAEHRLEEAVAATARTGSAGCVVLLDLDGFKEVNDRLGHGAGDELLRYAGELFRSGLRGSDRAYRLGGDEFCFYLPGQTAAEALGVVDRLRRRLEDETRILEMPVSFSAGCTALRPGDISPDDPLRRADALLYLAKANGKGRIVADGGGFRRRPEPLPAS